MSLVLKQPRAAFVNKVLPTGQRALDLDTGDEYFGDGVTAGGLLVESDTIYATAAEVAATTYPRGQRVYNLTTGRVFYGDGSTTGEVNSTAPHTHAPSEIDTENAIKEVEATTYTCLESDRGKVILLNRADPITVTVPTGLTVGWNAIFIQEGAGTVTFSASGTTIDNANGYTTTAGQDAAVTLLQKKTNVFQLGGEGA